MQSAVVANSYHERGGVALSLTETHRQFTSL